MSIYSKLKWIRRTEYTRLRYHERSNGKFRDLRGIEWHLGKHRFARISVNGQYRYTKAEVKITRFANPGWALGTNRVYIEWVHFRRHCWHLGFNALARGITFSYGRKIT